VGPSILTSWGSDSITDQNLANPEGPWRRRWLPACSRIQAAALSARGGAGAGPAGPVASLLLRLSRVALSCPPCG